METRSRSSSSGPAEGFTQRLKEDGRATIEQRKRSAAQRVEEIAQAIGRSGEQFGNEPTLAELAHRLANTVGNFATRLRDGSIDDLIDDTRRLARRNPALFIAGGVLAGFALARFAKASASRAERVVSEPDDAPVLHEDMVATVDVTTPGTSTSNAL